MTDTRSEPGCRSSAEAWLLSLRGYLMFVTVANLACYVMLLTVIFGLAYTLFSEWFNIEVRETWAYSDLMPVIPIIDAGLSPVLQWIVIPLAGFRFAMVLKPRRMTMVTADA